MENKTYQIKVKGQLIPVATKEVLHFNPSEYSLTEADIGRYQPLIQHVSNFTDNAVDGSM